MNDLVPVQNDNSLINYLDIQKFEHMTRIAKVFANSDLVPSHFKGRIENCFIAVQMAFRLNIDPMMALQNIYIVKGNPGVSAQLAISLANRAGVFSENIWFEETGTGNTLSVTAKAILAKNKREVSQTVSLAQAVQAGWTRQNDGGTKPFWLAMPSQMLRYRAAVYLIRAHCPDVILGMHTKEEWEDLGDGVQGQTNKIAPALAALNGQAEMKNVTLAPPLPEIGEVRLEPKPEVIQPTAATKPRRAAKSTLPEKETAALAEKVADEVLAEHKNTNGHIALEAEKGYNADTQHVPTSTLDAALKKSVLDDVSGDDDVNF